MKQKNLLWLVIGVVLLLVGIILSVFYKYAHCYSFFSAGLFIILIYTYNIISKKSIFSNWKFDNYARFFCFLIIISILIDKAALYLGYWIYPHYSSIFDELIKYIFEWVMPFLYFMLTLMIGKEIFKKFIKNGYISLILSLIIFVTLIGLFTEYSKSFSDSWLILSMPISNLKIGNFFLVFQTIGIWLLAFIPYYLYKIVNPREN